MENREIDLDQYRSHNVPIFSGRVRGQRLRDDLDLDKEDEEDRLVMVVIPDDVYSVSSSFWLGLFGDSVRSLGRDDFAKKYRFKGPNIGIIVADGVDEALKTGSPFDA